MITYPTWLRPLFAILLLELPGVVFAQDSVGTRHDSTLVRTLEAGDEADVVQPRRELIKWNHYEGKIFSIRFGGGFLEDIATFSQDEASKEQYAMGYDTKMRDARVLFKGRFGPKKMKHPVTYTMGIMYDAVNKKWLFRETGIMIGIPELFGYFFFGRTKEGFSLNKVMVGYAGWTNERSTMSDATVPILGDGVKWVGFMPRVKIGWNIGYYFDKFNQEQSFSTYDHQWVTRLMWSPILSEPKKTVLHFGLNLRQGKVDGDTLQLRSRPEAWTAPYFLDTKKFPAQTTFMYGGEIYYRRGPWLFGTEYWWHQVESPQTGNPLVHGGDIVATWMITGETREYNTAGGFFKGILPARTVFEGGSGAVEAVLRFSYTDMDDAGIRGGRFWRITPMINWHVSDNIRLEFTYGYGTLYKFDLIGHTQFFQGRLQLQL